MPGGGGVRDATKGGCYGGARGAKSSDTLGIGEEDSGRDKWGRGDADREGMAHKSRRQSVVKGRGDRAESRPVGWFQLYLFIFTQ